MITAYHAKYYAYELTLKRASTSVDRITTSLFDAHVDLNPHQIEAALFALRSPLSKGVILADEVGLGKTIEAGILLCQYWAEHKKQLLVICPASLRRQWSIELAEKFNLPCLILENDLYKTRLKEKNGASPLYFEGAVIMSFQFASRLKQALPQIPWDLVVIDEAHKLRNLYKAENKMGNNIRDALENFKKVLLTATPLQNSVMEVYGLASLIDPRIFGSVDSFRSRYGHPNAPFEELRRRMRPFVHRTLRSQVLEYIRYTKREAITHPFTPSIEEQDLYDRVSHFLLEEDSYAIPWAQRKLVVLIIRKLMASSTFALVGTLETIRLRLEKMYQNIQYQGGPPQTGQASDLDIHAQFPDEDIRLAYLPEIGKTGLTKGDRPIDIQKLLYERQQLAELETSARAIKVDAKARELLIALKIGFKRMKQLGGQHKALIFTESSRTQRYLYQFLSENGYDGQIVTFNGQNKEAASRAIYHQWCQDQKETGRLTHIQNVDMRLALIDFFREKGQIMIATEAAAEGINLQFCSLLVNYDLPWNPQRVEQRIGRVHRYGQQHDVVVINFLNNNNWADQRIYELLKEKFKLFDGVFGASDDILGQIDSGVDFEKRIYEIFETCRQPEQIETAFMALQAELEGPIQEKLTEAHQILFDHFDADVHHRLKYQMENTKKRMDDVTHMFWELTKYVYTTKYSAHASLPGLQYYFNDEAFIFGTDKDFIEKGVRAASHHQVPIYHYLDMEGVIAENKPPEFQAAGHRKQPAHGKRGLGERGVKRSPRVNPHRLSTIEGELVLKNGKQGATPVAMLTFDLAKSPHRIALLEQHVGKSGQLWLHYLVVTGFEEVEHLLFTIQTRDGEVLGQEVAEKLFLVPAIVTEGSDVFPNSSFDPIAMTAIEETEQPFTAMQARIKTLLQKSECETQGYFNEELDKLDRWAGDLKDGLELDLKKIDKEIDFLSRQTKQRVPLEDKLVFQKQKSALEKRRTRKRHALYTAQDEIDQKRDQLITQIENQLHESSHCMTELFRIGWQLSG